MHWLPVRVDERIQTEISSQRKRPTQFLQTSNQSVDNVFRNRFIVLECSGEFRNKCIHVAVGIASNVLHCERLVPAIPLRPPSVITSKAANSYHFKTGQRDWPSRTEIVLPCRLLWWQVGFGAPAPRAALEHVPVVQ